MMIGTVLRARRRLQTSSPSSRGSMMSRTTRSGFSSPKTSSASSPSRAETTRKPSRSSGYVRSFWTASSSSTSRMVGGSGIRTPAGQRALPPYYSPACPPPRPRAGGVARGVARSSGRSAGAPTAAPGCSSRSRYCSRRSRSRDPCRCRAPELPPAFDTRRRDDSSRAISRATAPDRSPRTAGATRCGDVVRGPAPAVRLRGPVGQVQATVAGRGRASVREPRRGRPGPLAFRDRRRCPS